MKEGRYAPDGSVWERTIYLHSLVVAVGRPAIRLDKPICATFAFKGKSCQIGQNFYRSQLKTVEAVVDGRRSRHMSLALFEMSSELVHGRNQYAWMAPKLSLIGVLGQPRGPSIELSRLAKTLRDSFKQGRAWVSEQLPAIAAPPTTEVPRTPSTDSAKPAALAKPNIDIRSGPNAWRSDPPPTEAPPELGTTKSDIPSQPGASNADPPTVPSDAYDGDAGGPHSLDEVIFD
jgi:hypothetical protein